MTRDSSVEKVPLEDFGLWNNLSDKRIPLSFEIEVTARCNNNCRHCYINCPENDESLREQELSFEDIRQLADDAVDLGALWCLITGGEPLLRDDFFDLYMYLKKKGLLVSVFTNGTLITDEHISLFKKYPPRDLEVSVYGAAEKTYESVTRRRGSYNEFIQGLNRLRDTGVPVRLKTMVLKSNRSELAKIVDFCKSRSCDPIRIDPYLHLRYDRNLKKNERIMYQRMTPEDMGVIDQSDKYRFQILKKTCKSLLDERKTDIDNKYLFRCSAGVSSFHIAYDGTFRLCSALCHPDCVYDLKTGTLREAWMDFVPRVRSMVSEKGDFKENCGGCPYIDLCQWCPAHAYLETGKLDEPVPRFCHATHIRSKLLNIRDSWFPREFSTGLTGSV